MRNSQVKVEFTVVEVGYTDQYDNPVTVIGVEPLGVVLRMLLPE